MAEPSDRHDDGGAEHGAAPPSWMSAVRRVVEKAQVEPPTPASSGEPAAEELDGPAGDAPLGVRPSDVKALRSPRSHRGGNRPSQATPVSRPLRLGR